ncbi:ELM1/GtrOC1 family putative glycosyltransferase [Marinobacter sp.]|uniref:ELM1/GtrOC1 family putative glycosyltransferase n=1 Tax=Marinobacter sp. TaxID=50741 RepID=UPI003A94BF4E
MTKLRVLILSDGVPGHVNQARGLVHWLSKRYELVCSEQAVSLRARPAARVLLPYALKVRGIGANVGKAFYRTHGLDGTPPDLIISAGGNTSFLNIALARKWSVPNVFLGSSRRLHSDDFAAHLTLEPTGEPHNIVMDLVPTGTNLSEQSRKGRLLRDSLQLRAQQPLYSLIVGGDGSGFIYEEATWRQLGELVADLSGRDDCRWLVTTSRRTGNTGEQLLRKALPQSVLADSVWWGNEPKKVMSSYLGAADAVFVTGDSMMMVNEAIASQKPTVVLEPDNAKPSERHRQALLRFQEAGYCNLHQLGSCVPRLPSNTNKDDRAGDRVLSQLEKLIPSLQRFR